MPDLLNPADDLANFDLLRGAIYTDPRNDANYPLRALPRPMSHTAARGLQQWATFAANDQVFYFPASQVPGVDCRDPDGVLHDAHGDRYAYVISEPILGGELWLWVGRREADPALAAYWKLDDKNPALTAGTIVDDVGDAHLTRGGDLLLPAASVPGIIDDALQFSGVIGGTGPRLTLPSGALPNINPLTIALWLKPAASVAMTLLDFGPLVLRHDGTKLHLTQGFSTTGGAWSKTCPLTAGQWTHLAVTYTRQAFDEAPILWRNAVDLDADEDAAPSGTIVSDAAATKLLGNNAALGEPIHGALDDVRLYSRELAPHELAALTALATIQP